MKLNSFQKCLPFSSDFFVFDRNHLIKINSMVFFSFLKTILLIGESIASAAKGFHMISSAQLEIKSL